MNITHTDAQLYEIAKQQGGYFSARPTRRTGFPKALLSHRVKRGRFRRLHRGGYRLAQFPKMPHADLFIAWLAAGERAVISHESALLLYGLIDLPPAEIHLTAPRTASRRMARVRFLTGRLGVEEVTRQQVCPLLPYRVRSAI